MSQINQAIRIKAYIDQVLDEREQMSWRYVPGVRVGDGLDSLGNTYPSPLTVQSLKKIRKSILQDANEQLNVFTTTASSDASFDISQKINDDVIKKYINFDLSAGLQLDLHAKKTSKQLNIHIIHSHQFSKTYLAPEEVQLKEEARQMLEKKGYAQFSKIYGTHMVTEIVNIFGFQGVICTKKMRDNQDYKINTRGNTGKIKLSYFIVKLKALDILFGKSAKVQASFDQKWSSASKECIDSLNSKVNLIGINQPLPVIMTEEHFWRSFQNYVNFLFKKKNLPLAKTIEAIMRQKSELFDKKKQAGKNQSNCQQDKSTELLTKIKQIYKLFEFFREDLTEQLNRQQKIKNQNELQKGIQKPRDLVNCYGLELKEQDCVQFMEVSRQFDNYDGSLPSSLKCLSWSSIQSIRQIGKRQPRKSVQSRKEELRKFILLRLIYSIQNADYQFACCLIQISEKVGRTWLILRQAILYFENIRGRVFLQQLEEVMSQSPQKYVREAARYLFMFHRYNLIQRLFNWLLWSDRRRQYQEAKTSSDSHVTTFQTTLQPKSQPDQGSEEEKSIL